MTPKEQAIAMLAQGLSTSVVAQIVGVTESYISQLKNDEDVVAKLAATAPPAPALTAADLDFDSKLDTAESMALSRIEKGLPFANMGQALMAFRILNQARRRKEAVNPSAAQQQLTLNVNLTLPARTLPEFVVNQQSEIVEVDGRTLVTTTPNALDGLLAARQNAKLGTTVAPILEKAAERLDGITATRPPRRQLPTISVDML